MLRALDQVRARGLLLPDGLLTCTTCHSGSSRAAFRVSLPLDRVQVSGRLCNACHVMPGDEDRGPAYATR